MRKGLTFCVGGAVEESWMMDDDDEEVYLCFHGGSD
jgi:hypothetical protein